MPRVKLWLVLVRSRRHAACRVRLELWAEGAIIRDVGHLIAHTPQLQCELSWSRFHHSPFRPTEVTCKEDFPIITWVGARRAGGKRGPGESNPVEAAHVTTKVTAATFACTHLP